MMMAWMVDPVAEAVVVVVVALIASVCVVRDTVIWTDCGVAEVVWVVVVVVVVVPCWSSSGSNFPNFPRYQNLETVPESLDCHGS